MIPPMRKSGEPETEEEHDIQPASAIRREGFSPWRAKASSAPIVEDEETTSESVHAVKFRCDGPRLGN